MTDKHR